MDKTIYPVGDYNLDRHIMIVGKHTIIPLAVQIDEDRSAVVLYSAKQFGGQVKELTCNGKVQLNRERNGFEILASVLGARLHFTFRM